MKFFEKLMIEEYLNEDSYQKATKGGGDAGSSDEHFAERLVLPNIKKAKSKKELDLIVKKLKDARKRGNYVYDNVKSIVDSWVKTRMEELKIGESINEAPIGSKGWTQASVSKFGKTIGKSPQEHGFFDACVSRMEGKKGFDSQKAKGFCASLKDASYGSSMWRGKDKSKKEIKKDVKEKPFKKQLPKGK